MFSKEDALSTNKVLIILLQQCINAQELVIVNNTHIGDSTMSQATSTLCSLTHLSICGCPKLTIIALKRIASANPGLTALRLLGNPHISGVRVCDILVEFTPHLISLGFTFSNGDSRAVRPSLAKLFHTCTALTTLSVNSWDALLHAHNYPSLTSLDIDHSMIPYHSEVQWQSKTHLLSVSVNVKNMRDATSAFIASTHPQLTALHIHNSNEVSNASVHSIMSHCTELRHLSLTNCPLISSNALHTLASVPHCPLYSLDISHVAGINTEDVVRVMRGCALLKELKKEV
eukprot:gene24698-31072_t